MRIIAGSARRLPLKTVNGQDTRPTTDRIKETLFNMLQADVAGSYFLDLFAGSGQIGLEAVSRGAEYAVFVENQKKAAACIKDNIAFTKFDRMTKLYLSDVFSALRAMEGKFRFDIIFMDPPYDRHLERDVLQYLSASSLLKEDTIIIAEVSADTSFEYLTELNFTLEKLKNYKTNAHAFIRKMRGE